LRRDEISPEERVRLLRAVDQRLVVVSQQS
jgi:hypothetical protein